jgi:hypothetical protein
VAGLPEVVGEFGGVVVVGCVTLAMTGSPAGLIAHQVPPKLWMPSPCAWPPPASPEKV